MAAACPTSLYYNDLDMKDIANRTYTFVFFPTWSKADPSELAAAGFFYTGSSDEVKCYSCATTYKDSKTVDNPVTVHLKENPFLF